MDPLPAVLVCAHVRPCLGLNYSLLSTQKTLLLATLASLRKKRTRYLVEVIVLTMTLSQVQDEAEHFCSSSEMVLKVFDYHPLAF